MAPPERQVKQIGVEVQDIECGCAAKHLLQLQHMQRHGFWKTRVEPQRRVPDAHELGASMRVAAGEERNVVAEPDELFRQIRHDALSSPVQPGWNTLVE